MNLLEKKVCIITGAAQGIGRAIAEQFAADGAIVYACDMKEGTMDEWAVVCAEKYQTKIIPLYFVKVALVCPIFKLLLIAFSVPLKKYAIPYSSSALYNPATSVE